MVAGFRAGTISIGFSGWTARGVLPRSDLGQQGDRILITPFDKSVIPAIVRALNEARLNAYALNPSTVSVSVPPISEEERAEIARHVEKLGEDAKVAVRAIRQEARQRIEVSGRGSHRGVQEATDVAVAEIDRLVRLKTEEVGFVRSAGQEGSIGVSRTSGVAEVRRYAGRRWAGPGAYCDWGI
jgi:ribosome recycling factor